MTEQLLRAASLTGIGALLIMPDAPASLAIWGVLITSLASLAKQILDKRAEAQRAERDHRFALEDRLAAKSARRRLRRSIAENTALTREVGAQAAQAYETANHVNEKIASIAAAALKGGIAQQATLNASTLAIRHDIADASAEAREARA